ncbi:YopX family protein [Staphylococcus saprophyticus]|uniref:YopX family protein n=1 Tax=Staphylococcus saprophyticus TaxID=29385 RepID=UPI0009906005|nr:YopX family protein [Staphylococcus saprophyticus]OOO72395.1 hypothetical protein B0W56_00470 [Staphylococcus saprophyticus]
MENLRFRAWDKFDKEMLEVHGINFDAQGIWTREMIDDESDGNFVFLDEVELLQSTGLKDKHGVEIFEGDVLKVFIFDGKGPHAKVIFKNGLFGIEDDMFGYGYDKGLYTLDQIISIRDAEVIGNKYEHPHLLEGEMSSGL